LNYIERGKENLEDNRKNILNIKQNLTANTLKDKSLSKNNNNINVKQNEKRKRE
jgi:hypothetical protein